MKVGLQLPMFTWPGGPAIIRPRLAEIARTAEAAGFASLWMMDHYFQVPPLGPADDPMPEAYTTLGYLAVVTERIALGPLVAGVIYRHPGVLVKCASTLDVLAGGRTYFGVGAAWYKEEALALGIPYPPEAVRYEWLEETLQIAHQMWRGDRRPFVGRHFRLEGPIDSPPPLSRPHPPIMIGGNGERLTLRLVAEYGDACNFLVLDPPEIRAKLEVLKRHCDEVGRPYEAIERTALNELGRTPGETPADVVAFLRAMADAGIEHVIVNLPNAHELTPLEIYGREIIPAAAEL